MQKIFSELFGDRILVLAVLAAMLLAVPLVACGGDDDDANGNGNGGDNTPAPTTGGDDATPESDGDSPVDLSDAPDPGVAVLEVDGQTFRGELHVCDLTETSFLIGATLEADGEQIEYGANGGRSAEGRNWTAQSAMTIDGSVAYVSANGDVGVDGDTVIYSGNYTKLADSGSQSGEDVEGRLAATCSN